MEHKHVFFQQDVLAQLFDGLYITDTNRRITYWNAAAEKMTGFSKEEVLGKCCSDNILMHINDEGEQLCTIGCPLSLSMQTGKHQEADVFLHHKNGYRMPVKVRVSPLTDTEGNIVGAVEVFTDNTSELEKTNRISELEQLALWDELTQLPNRRHLQQLLEMRFAEFERTGATFGLAVIDIDHFKRVNDTYGHDAGDRVLQIVAQTMNHSKRAYDIVGRWGGEEFLLIAPSINSSQLHSLMNRLRMLVEKSRYTCENKQLNITVSLGGAVVCNGDTPHTLFKKADHMLYESKEGGRNRVNIQPEV